MYPINSTPESLFRTIFNKNSLNVVNQINFLAKNYRPKCDMCSNLCNMEWYMHSGGSSASEEKNSTITFESVKEILLICENCYETDNFPKGVSKDNFESANFFNIISSSESKIKFY